MELLTKHIKSGVKNFNIPIVKTQTYIPSELLAHLQSEFKNSQFTVKEAIMYVSSFNTQSIHTMYSVGYIYIHVLTPNIQDIPPHLLLTRVIKRLYVVSQVFKIQHNVHFWFIPTDINRKFPKTSIVTPEHINGGFTYAANATNDKKAVHIYIYRREDFPKVMLHELMHHSFINKNIHNSHETRIVNTLKTICNIDPSTEFLPNEGIIEAWALILQSLFISLDYNIPFNIIMQKEKAWSLKQTSRLLYYKKNKAWKETTNSYCYFVIKACCLNNPVMFIKSCLDNTAYMYLESNIQGFIKNIVPMPMKHTRCRMSIFGDM